MIHLELQPEIEAQLAAQAQNHGLPIERYVEGLLTLQVEPTQLVSPAEAVAGIREWRKGNRLAGIGIKELITEGRKY